MWQKLIDGTGAGGSSLGLECTLLSLRAPKGGAGTVWVKWAEQAVAAGQRRGCGTGCKGQWQQQQQQAAEPEAKTGHEQALAAGAALQQC